MFYTNRIPISSPPPCFLSSNNKKNAKTHPPPMRKVTIEQTLMKFLQNLEKNSNNAQSANVISQQYPNQLLVIYLNPIKWTSIKLPVLI